MLPGHMGDGRGQQVAMAGLSRRRHRVTSAIGSTAAAMADKKVRGRSSGSTVCGGKENDGPQQPSGKSRTKNSSRPMKVRPEAANVLRLPPAEDDWDDLV